MGSGGPSTVISGSSTTRTWTPSTADRFEVFTPGRDPVTHPGAGADRYSFTPALRHIQAVVQGREAPRWLAVDTSLGSARALADLAASAS